MTARRFIFQDQLGSLSKVNTSDTSLNLIAAEQMHFFEKQSVIR
jgi:hypothetical protein